jgi:hypothetical protein
MSCWATLRQELGYNFRKQAEERSMPKDNRFAGVPVDMHQVVVKVPADNSLVEAVAVKRFVAGG